eukprot:SAG11_NODE_8142_length_1055_cov_1.459205_1_plen_83_part_10
MAIDSEMRSCKLKLAQLWSLELRKEPLEAALQIYEEVSEESAYRPGTVHHHVSQPFAQVARSSLESNLLKWSVKQIYLKALIC